MAIHFKNPKATFIHIPKTAGSSFQQWAKDNFENIIIGPHGYRHAKASDLKTQLGDLGYTFTFVRNPYARLVSMFYFIGQRAEERMEKRRQGKKAKKSTNEYDDIKIIEQYNRGFEEYIYNLQNWDPNQPYEAGDRWYTRKTPMVEWLDEKTDLIIQVENINEEFVKLQDLLNCKISLPHLNKSSHKNYRDYYNKTTKKIVEEIYKDDLETFGYKF
jgi:hypothetical protein